MGPEFRTLVVPLKSTLFEQAARPIIKQTQKKLGQNILITLDLTINEANSSKNEERRKPCAGKLLVAEKIFLLLASVEDLAAVVKPEVGQSCCGFDRGVGNEEGQEANDKEAKETEDGGEEDRAF